ncbi:uncharacterized protein BDR25DRAFT_280572 [Lindgomyces ingoldianus]|uniref:Uncharacterized protein n=1 Tax=Lindgomyces ingoldianus TaxID=673940 RepID=A0ACB6R6R0_9PLEO|nr:uncharacterized protein BDR25DRAFT_280572 [Lindgomyces ingoldianus]KAF2474944.1 hypothetical protein BDR25DRAFT_280572 [Lindgomyces ingoldianus]
MASSITSKPPSCADNRIQLPGFGRPFNHWGFFPVDELFPTAVETWNHDVITIRERCMLHFINQITDKPEWNRKVHDEEIVAKWKKEAMELDWDAKVVRYGDMSEQMLEYCIKELRDKATLYEKTGIIPVLDVNTCVIKTDSTIPAPIKEALKKAVARLENVPATQKDWHPGSDDKVLDLVHPSLFPLVYGRSRVLPTSTTTLEDCLQNIGKGEIVAKPQNTDDALENLTWGIFSIPRKIELWSTRYQWLPCNISFRDGNARIDSYINNLHPVDHRDLYQVIEQIITESIPLWNIIYQSHNEGRLVQGKRIECMDVEGDEPLDEEDDEDEDNDEDENDDDDSISNKAEERRSNERVMVKPEPNEYRQPSIKAKDVEECFTFLGDGEKKIQVIVKLANIHLTPEKPKYHGGSWHIEGQLNEHICATTLYYYDNHNITDSHLAFRTKVDGRDLEDDLNYEQGDDDGIRRIFGIINGRASVQELGKILTREDRLLAFPNVLQHRVGSFKLADTTTPGHRKILALFLVDPKIPILSTANVPPQQREWWMREVTTQGGKMGKLPAELVQIVEEAVEEFPLGMEEAKKIRKELMTERAKLDQEATSAVECYDFSFCEH